MECLESQASFQVLIIRSPNEEAVPFVNRGILLRGEDGWGQEENKRLHGSQNCTPS